MVKFEIKLNKSKVKEERSKGSNRCKDNSAAFYDHKKGILFPKY